MQITRDAAERWQPGDLIKNTAGCFVFRRAPFEILLEAFVNSTMCSLIGSMQINHDLFRKNISLFAVKCDPASCFHTLLLLMYRSAKS